MPDTGGRMIGEAEDRSGGGIEPWAMRGLGDGIGWDGRRIWAS